MKLFSTLILVINLTFIISQGYSQNNNHLKEFITTIDENNKLKSIDVYFNYVMPKDTILNLLLRTGDFMNYKRYKIIPPDKFGLMLEWSAISCENDTVKPLKMMLYTYAGKYRKLRIKAKKGDVFKIKLHIETGSVEERVLRRSETKELNNIFTLKEILLIQTNFFDQLNNRMLEQSTDITTYKLKICPASCIE